MSDMMKKTLLAVTFGLALGACVCMVSCRSHYAVVAENITRVPIDNGITPDAAALQLIAPYSVGVDSLMNIVLGQAEMSMDRGRPESPLGNLISEVLRLSAVKAIGKTADIGIVNVGGMRRELEAGNITMAEAYEILPFENSLCVLTMTGKQVAKVLGNLSVRGGEGVSGLRMTIDGKGGYSDVTIGGQPFDESKTYTIATIDYLCEGNDGMTGLLDFEDKVCPEGMTLRGLFIEYVQQQTAEGKKITSSTDGRIKLAK